MTNKPKSFEETIEDEIKAKNLNAPRVTKEHVDALFNQLEFVVGRATDTLTICTAQLDGFMVANGYSACVSPENYDEEIGVKIAQRKAALAAYDELWKLEGYRLSRSLKEAVNQQESVSH